MNLLLLLSLCLGVEANTIYLEDQRNNLIILTAVTLYIIIPLIRRRWNEAMTCYVFASAIAMAIFFSRNAFWDTMIHDLYWLPSNLTGTYNILPNQYCCIKDICTYACTNITIYLQNYGICNITLTGMCGPDITETAKCLQSYTDYINNTHTVTNPNDCSDITTDINMFKIPSFTFLVIVVVYALVVLGLSGVVTDVDGFKPIKPEATELKTDPELKEKELMENIVVTITPNVTS